MNLNFTQNLHGILSGSTLLDESSDQGCRTVEHKSALYCTYLSDSGNQIKVIAKPTASNWDFSAPATCRTSAGIPGLVSFKDTLYMFYRNDRNTTTVCRYVEPLKTFVSVSETDDSLSETPAFAVLNGVLHMFYKVQNSVNIFHKTTADLETWNRLPLIKTDGVRTALSHLSPVAVTYQNLIHLIYGDRNAARCYLLKSDGLNWTSRILITDTPYAHSPGLTVHNGLLKLAFAGQDGALKQYAYDGHSVSPAVSSTLLACSPASPSLAVQNGALVAVFSY